MKASWALAVLLLAAPARCQSVSSGAVRLALIEDTPTHFSDDELSAPLVHLLQQNPSSGTFDSLEMMPCYYSGSDYRFRLPEGFGNLPDQTPAALLETDSVVALVAPPIPDLVSGLLQAAQDPASYEEHWSVRPATRSLDLSVVQAPTGETLVTALLDPSKGEGARWHNTVAALVRLRWQRQEAFVILAGKEFGGLSRLAGALRKERGHGPPIIGLAHRDVFGEPLSELKGTALTEALEKLGLSYAAVGSAEIFNWKDISAYRASRPQGVQFLSANLVYSSAPATTFLPDHAILEAGGLKVAVTAVTPAEAARYLAHSGLGGLQVADPIKTLKARLPGYRSQADLVVLLAHNRAVSPELRALRGVDLILAEPGEAPAGSRPAEVDWSQSGRRLYDPPLGVLRRDPRSLEIFEASLTRRQDAVDLRVKSRPVLLDESAPASEAFSEFQPEAVGITFSTEAPLIPSSHEVFPPAPGTLPRDIEARDFWTMASVLLAEETGSEAGLLRAWPLGMSTGAPIKESLLRVWLRYDDTPVRVSLKGAQLKALLAESQAAGASETGANGRPAFVVGGIGPSGTTTVHGLPLDPNENYRVTTSLTLAEVLGLASEREPVAGKKSVSELVIAALRRRQGSPPSTYGDWMAGEPLAAHGLWRINFRDVSLSLQDTQVTRSDAFNVVPNPRIQGSDQILIGAVVKTDADYLLQDYKWGNTLELNYARSRLTPRDQPPVTNVSANDLSVTTRGTRRLGAGLPSWMAHAWGPSLALNYDGQLEATPPLRRRNVVSLYPGVEFYDGTWVRSLTAGGNIKRDYSVVPVDTQYGLRGRMLVNHDIGPAPIKFVGEAWANYFFLTGHDQPQDLRWESDVNFKFNIPIRKYLTIAPFMDFYTFALKTSPTWGWSAMTGVSIGFTRVWKPQYEAF